MATGRTRVFIEPSASVSANLATLFAGLMLIFGVGLVGASIRFGASPAWLALAAAMIAVAVPGLRWQHRLRRMGFSVGEDGVHIIGPRRDQDVPWSEVRGIYPRPTEPGDAALPVVMLELADGQKWVAMADRGLPDRRRREQTQRRVEDLCRQLEAYRPAEDRQPSVVAENR